METWKDYISGMAGIDECRADGRTYFNILVIGWLEWDELTA